MKSKKVVLGEETGGFLCIVVLALCIIIVVLALCIIIVVLSLCIIIVNYSCSCFVAIICLSSVLLDRE